MAALITLAVLITAGWAIYRLQGWRTSRASSRWDPEPLARPRPWHFRTWRAYRDAVALWEIQR